MIVQLRILLFIMGNTLDGYCYRLQKNDADLVEISCNDEGLVNIGDEGALEFSSALATNTTLQTLDLGGMGVGDDGVAALAQALVLNKTLTLLRLHRNKISDEGAKKLITALRHNHSITALYIAMNVIRSDDLNDEIQRLVELNKLGPEEAARKKAELYSPGWVAEGAELRREAEKQLLVQQVEAMAVGQSQEQGEYPSLMCRKSAYSGYARGHEKKD